MGRLLSLLLVAGQVVAAVLVVGCLDVVRSEGEGPADVDIEWIRIPGGRFNMGSEPTRSAWPVHPVDVPTFELARTEVTVAQYRACVDAGGCEELHWDDETCWFFDGLDWEQGRLPDSFRGVRQPVVCADWNQARAFAAWVGGRLPSEAEWEYAARSGGRDQIYPWGNGGGTCEHAVMSDAWDAAPRDGCGEDRTWGVCSKPAGNSAQGLCDLAGNVDEWVEDCWHESYGEAPADGTAWIDECWEGRGADGGRVFRGGSWIRTAGFLRASSRRGGDPRHRRVDVGFRPARSSP